MTIWLISNKVTKKMRIILTLSFHTNQYKFIFYNSKGIQYIRKQLYEILQLESCVWHISLRK